MARPSAASNSALIGGTTRMPPLLARARNGSSISRSRARLRFSRRRPPGRWRWPSPTLSPAKNRLRLQRLCAVGQADQAHARPVLGAHAAEDC